MVASRHTPLIGATDDGLVAGQRSDRSRSRPLDGVRVIDFTSAWAGPRLAVYLAELGAHVIHVESIQYLDAHRGWSKWGGGAYGLHPDNVLGERPWERCSLFVSLNKGKRGLTLNLRDDRGRDLFRRLIAVSDVLLDNYRAGQLARFGLDEAAVRGFQPDIILISLPAFGTWGPHRDWTAWGDQASAIAGLGRLFNYRGDEEPEVGSTYGDPVAAVSGTLAVLAALRHRAKTGQGQTIEAPLAEGIIPLLPEPIIDWSMNRRIADPVGSSHQLFVPWGFYPAAGDDQWVALGVEDDQSFQRLCKVMGRPEMGSDRRFATVAGRLRNRAEVDSLVSSWTQTLAASTAGDILQAAGIAAEPLNTHQDLFRDRQMVAREFFVSLEHRDTGLYPYIGPPARYGAGSAYLDRSAPSVGEDNERILGDLLGLSPSELAHLSEDLVTGHEPLEDDARVG